MKANQEIREKAKRCSVSLGEIADHLGISKNTIWRKLSNEVTAEQKIYLLKAIDEIVEKRFMNWLNGESVRKIRKRKGKSV